MTIDETEVPLTKWEFLETYLFDHDLLNTEFNVHALAEDMGIAVPQATDYIQSYLDAQNRASSKTLFVLHRLPGTRTSSAVWRVGVRRQDVRQMHQQLQDDLQRRVERAVEPTIRRMGQKNHQAAEMAEAVTEVISDVVKLLMAMMNGRGDADDG